MYNILFFITSNDNLNFLDIFIQNVLKYNSNCGVVVHINKTKMIDNKKLNELKQKNNVFFVEPRIETRMCKIMTPLVYMNDYALTHNINYEYMCMIASNCFFFRKGCYEYIASYDYGCYSDFKKYNNFTDKFKDCKDYQLTIGASDEPTYSGQHEGCFYKKELYGMMCDSLKKFCKIENMNNLQDTTEECFLPTAANILLKDYKRGLPVCIIRDRIHNNIVGTDEMYNLEQTIQFLKILTLPNIKIKYVLNDNEENHFYCFKRVDRDLNDALLQYFINNEFC